MHIQQQTRWSCILFGVVPLHISQFTAAQARSRHRPFIPPSRLLLLVQQMFKRKSDNRDGAPLLQSMNSLCKYPGRKCLGQRVAKTTGELHNFCEQHRLSANETKRKSHRNKTPKLEETASDSTRLACGEPSPLHSGDGAVTKERKAQGDSTTTAFARNHHGWQCTYSSSYHCNLVRTKKTTGGMHRFCEYHAEKARLDQRKSAQKKRGSFDATSQPTIDASAEIVDSELLWTDIPQHRGACELLAYHGLGLLIMNSPVDVSDTNETLVGFTADGQAESPDLEVNTSTQWTFDKAQDITNQAFQCMGDMQPQAVLAFHGLESHTLGLDFDWSADDMSNTNLDDHVFGSIDKPAYGLMDYMREEEVDIIAALLPLWLPDFVDNVCASLDLLVTSL